MKKLIQLSLLSFVLFNACVSPRAFEDVKSERDAYKEANDKNKTRFDALKEESDNRAKSVELLKKDTAELHVRLKKYEALNAELNEKLEQLITANERLTTLTMAENTKLSGQLNVTEQKLKDKEEQLNKLADSLAIRESRAQALANKLADASSKLDEKDSSINAKEKNIAELKARLEAQDSAVNALQNTVSKALAGFVSSGLEVTTKEGKVYVSLSEQLLFASGSTAIDKRGKEALKNLAQILNANKEIRINVEGHTDNVPYKGTGPIKDNWDLSVLRATTIVKILTDEGIAPERILASGRGQYNPVNNANTAEARKTNRRTEIILSPNLDELYKLIEK